VEGGFHPSRLGRYDWSGNPEITYYDNANAATKIEELYHHLQVQAEGPGFVATPLQTVEMDLDVDELLTELGFILKRPRKFGINP
jgi:hypothetical protein